MGLQTAQKVRIYITAAVMLFILPLIIQPMLTGFVVAPVFKQPVRLEFTVPQTFKIQVENNRPLSSFRVNGEIIGDGEVQIMLENTAHETLKVFDNLRQRRGPLSGITAMFFGIGIEKDIYEGKSITLTPLPSTSLNKMLRKLDNYETFDGLITAECSETCALTDGNNYNLIVLLEEGTRFRLDDIIYTLQ